MLGYDSFHRIQHLMNKLNQFLYCTSIKVQCLLVCRPTYSATSSTISTGCNTIIQSTVDLSKWCIYYKSPLSMEDTVAINQPFPNLTKLHYRCDYTMFCEFIARFCWQ